MIRTEGLSFKIGDFQLHDVSIEIPNGEYFPFWVRPARERLFFWNAFVVLCEFCQDRSILMEKTSPILSPGYGASGTSHRIMRSFQICPWNEISASAFVSEVAAGRKWAEKFRRPRKCSVSDNCSGAVFMVSAAERNRGWHWQGH